MDNQPELAGRSRMSARSLGSEQGRGRPLPIGRALPNTKTAPTGLQLVSSPPGETRPADRTACSPHLRSVRAVAIGTLAQRAWQRPPGRLRLEAATFSGGIAVLGETLKTRCSPATRVPSRSFFETTPDRTLQRSPIPLRGGDSMAEIRCGTGISQRLLAIKATRLSRSTTPCRSTSLKHSCSPRWEPPESAQNR